MSQDAGARLAEIAGRLVERLTALRASKADAPEDERRRAIAQVLREELAELSADAAGKVIARIRQHFITEARLRDERIAALEQELGTVKSQLESTVAKVDSTTAELERARTENRQLNERLSQRASTGAESGAQLERIREALLRASQGEEVDAESLDISEDHARLFRLIQRLLDFAIKYELGLNFMLAEFKIGPSGDADTKITRGMEQQVRTRFEASVRGEEGSLRSLSESLDRNATFLINLNRAYQTSLYAGNKEMLTRLDPRPLQEKHKRLVGTDFEAAWKSMSRIQADLANLSRTELWDQFYLEPFRKKLKTYIEED